MTLSWITAVWSSVVAACLTFGLVHLAIWFANVRQQADLKKGPGSIFRPLLTGTTSG